MKPFSINLLFVLGLCSAFDAQAGVTLTFSGQIVADPTDTLSVGDDVSYSFTINPDYTDTAADDELRFFNGFGTLQYAGDEAIDGALFSDISGTSVTGDYTLATDPNDELLFVELRDVFSLTADREGVSEGGLGLMFGDTEIGVITVEDIQTSDGAFSLPDEFQEIDTYLTPLAGEHTLTQDAFLFFTLVGGDTVTVSLTGLEASIPEPSSLALLGLGSLALLRRRRATRE